MRCSSWGMTHHLRCRKESPAVLPLHGTVVFCPRSLCVAKNQPKCNYSYRALPLKNPPSKASLRWARECVAQASLSPPPPPQSGRTFWQSDEQRAAMSKDSSLRLPPLKRCGADGRHCLISPACGLEFTVDLKCVRKSARWFVVLSSLCIGDLHVPRQVLAVCQYFFTSNPPMSTTAGRGRYHGLASSASEGVRRMSWNAVLDRTEIPVADVHVIRRHHVDLGLFTHTQPLIFCRAPKPRASLGKALLQRLRSFIPFRVFFDVLTSQGGGLVRLRPPA